MLDLKTFNCCGCAACANICPKGAIKLVVDKDGFYVPQINKDLCIDCGLCEKKCPQINDIKKHTRTPDCYAVMADDETRYKSSSGGAFTVIANEIFNRGGVVCGAAFDENWTVKHIIIENEDDMDKLRGSKYVQSFISEDLYKNLKAYLDAQRWVLFTGTPCQVAGFKSFLTKDYEKLLTVDIICSKVPPKKLFDKFLKDNYGTKTIKNINFRDKNNGWNCSTTSITIDDEIKLSKSWFRMYLNSLSMNESCVHCKYMSADRVSDITIGDFWGIERICPELNDKKGTSCVLINTENAQLFFNNLNWQKKELLTVQNAIDGNRALCVPFIPNQNRFFFTNKINKNIEDFNTIVEDCLSIKKSVGILNWWWNSNRGAILTCYAIQELVKELGYNPSVIKHIPFDYYNSEYIGSISEKFAQKYLNLTEWCHSRIDMRRLNEHFDTFMVGSDMVWNHKLNWFLQDFYYLNFAEIKKNIISCAASFGLQKFAGNDSVTKRVEYYLSRFNNISVREKEGVRLLKNTFGMDGTFILDPVFLVNPEVYSDLANKSTKTDKKYIAYYSVNKQETAKLLEIVKAVSEKLQIPYIDIKGENSVEDWLYYIKNAEFVISNSFHCSAFSMIFEKKFLTLRRDAIFNKDTRIKTLIDVTGTQSQFIKISDFDIEKLDEYMVALDYATLKNRILPEKERSIAWLKNALENNNKEVTKEQERMEAVYADMDDRLNYLEAKCTKIDILEEKINKLESKQNKNKITLKYYFYKILTNFTPKKSKFREKLLLKKDKYKNLYRQVK